MLEHVIKHRILLVILFFICQVVWMFSNYSILDLAELPIPVATSLFFLMSFWILLLLDMIKNNIFNKTFWIISMFVMPWLAPAFYLFQRKRR
jgi:hypothetical protein